MLAGWDRIDVAGKPAEVFAPPNSAPLTLVYLHSLAEESPSDCLNFTAQLRQWSLNCLAPSGGWCWWSDRICSAYDSALSAERYLLDVLLPWAEEKRLFSGHGVALAGVEMGGQGALRLAFRHPDRFPIAASISGALDCQDWYGQGTPLDEMYASREMCRLDTAILHIHGHDWPRHIWFCCSPDDPWSYRGNDRLHEKLAAMGVPHTADLDTRADAGRDYPDFMMPRMFEFVAESLAKESRRLL